MICSFYKMYKDMYYNLIMNGFDSLNKILYILLIIKMLFLVNFNVLFFRSFIWLYFGLKYKI